jgi:hypothetical protein
MNAGPTLSPRSGCMTVVLVLLGIVLLLPGLCALAFTVGFVFTDPSDLFTDSGDLWFLWLACFAIAAVGIMLLRQARRRG